MDVKTASTHINRTLIHLEQVVGEPVFNEWVLVEKTESGWKAYMYCGSRRDDFFEEFKSDIETLHEALDPDRSFPGDFAFSHEGFGSGFDAYICVGTRLFVLFNNTEKSTDDIVANPQWKSAQIHFSRLLEHFIQDPAVP
jgi:hypothetical protein